MSFCTMKKDGRRITICSDTGEMFYTDHYGRKSRSLEDSRPIPAGMMKITQAKPPTSYYHYSNENSQGALICQTPGFPRWFNPKTEKYFCGYSDRISGWDRARYQRACKIAGGGDQAWAYNLPKLSTPELKEFAKVALDLPSLPSHVRIVHHFNASNGFSCPTVEVIYAEKA